MKCALAGMERTSRAGDTRSGHRGSKVVDSLDTLLADMESFRSSKVESKEDSRKIQIEVEKEKDENIEKKLDNLTDKLMDVLKSESEDTITAGTEDDLGHCNGCSLPISDSAVLAGGHKYHQGCFKCVHCKERLGEQFFVVGDKNYCPRHQTVALENCTSCEQPIKEGSVLVNKKPYHPHCFTCVQCLHVIDGKFFTQKDGTFVCEQDYNQGRDKCDHCKLPVLDKVLTAVDKKFHPSCFRCGLCDTALEGVPFLVSAGSVNCKPCYTKYKAAKCVRCSQGIVSSGERKTSLVTCQGKTYHQECYTCGDCSKVLTGEFVCAAGDEIVCFSCDTRRKK